MRDFIDDLSDGDWPVEEIDGVRGPPENRFWKLRWAPYTDEENDVHVKARNSGEHVQHIPEVKMQDEDGNVMLDDDGNDRHVPNVY